MPKVSVIVPIYGVEKYIERCARSLFEQTLEDIEFIFVNDCTKDRSIELLENIISEYPLRKEKTKIINKNINQGLSKARETGIKYATGEYICHCDSDDWVDNNMYETLYNLAKSNNYEFVKCGYKVSDGDNIIEGHNIKSPAILDRNGILKLLISNQGWNSIWTTMVKKDVYMKGIIFTDEAMLEDFLLSTQLILHSSSFAIVNAQLYNYFYNNNSICTKKENENFINRATQAKNNIDKIIKLLSEANKLYFLYKELVPLKYIAKNLMIPVMDNIDNYALWDSIYPELTHSVWKSNYFSCKEKIRFYIASFKLYKYTKL